MPIDLTHLFGDGRLVHDGIGERRGSITASSTCGRRATVSARRGARAEQIGEKCQQAIVIDQDHHQLDRRRHFAEGVVEPRQRAIGIRGAAERGEQGRCEFGEDFACAGAGDGRAGARNASRAPSLPRARDRESRAAPDVAIVSGSISEPVKIRLPASEASSGPSSKSSA